MRVEEAINTCSICHWNVGGLVDGSTGNLKTDDPEVLKQIVKFDIIVITESHVDSNTDVSVTGYNTFMTSRTKHPKAKRLSGEIIILVKNEIQSGVRCIRSETPDLLWLCFQK